MHSILEVQDLHARSVAEIAKREQERSATQLERVLAWLDTKDYQQEDFLDVLTRKAYPGTSDWFLEDRRIQQWIGDGLYNPSLWVNGIPGAGKSSDGSFMSNTDVETR